MARYSRTSIRYQKEAALRPGEDTKTTIERQLIDIEKKINRVKSFTGDEPEVEHDVFRCAYCGRRVTPGIECSGCGSDRTILISGNQYY